MERRNLKVFRVSQGLTQEGMAKRLGINRTTYALVEKGKSGTSRRFTARFQKAFSIPDEEMWKLLKTTDEEKE